MIYRPTDTASKIVALLDNAEVLAVRHQKRKIAVDVVQACKIFSEGRGFSVPALAFDSLSAAVKGKMNQELIYLFDRLKRQVVAEDMETQKTQTNPEGLSDWHSLAAQIRGQ